MESVGSTCKGQWVFPRTAFFQCFTSSFCCSVTAVPRSNFSILSPFPSCLPVPLSDACSISIIIAVSGEKKTSAPQRQRSERQQGPPLGAWNWHLHFKRGRLNEPRHFFFFFFYNIRHAHFSCSTTSSVTISCSLCIRLSFSVSIDRHYLTIWGWYQVWHLGGNKERTADTS